MADLVRDVKEAGYIALGFALLGIQQAQVRRRELEKELKRLMDERCAESGEKR